MRHFISFKEFLTKCHIELFISQDEYIMSNEEKDTDSFLFDKGRL